MKNKFPLFHKIFRTENLILDTKVVVTTLMEEMYHVAYKFVFNQLKINQFMRINEINF